MPSPSLRLLQKTSGLFDTGFAGSAYDAASHDMNAPVSGAADQFLSELGLAGPGKVSSVGEELPYEIAYTSGPSTSYQKAFPEPQQQLQKSAAEETGVDCDWDALGESLADLDADQLADDSLDAFVNLDQLLMGDAFLNQMADVQPVDEMKTQLTDPVNELPVLDSQNLQHLDLFDLLDGETEMSSNILNAPLPPLPLSAAPEIQAAVPPTVNVPSSSKATTSRKRKSTAKAETKPCKTSMFEIPVSEDVVSTTFIEPVSPGLDHDYSVKQEYTMATAEFDSYGTLKLTETVAQVSEPGTSTQVFPVPTSGKLDKVALRRQKNNLASKRSREQRKQKFSDLDLEAEELIVKNDALRKKIVELEKIAKDMKAALVAKMAGK